jgi:hypothetical protein
MKLRTRCVGRLPALVLVAATAALAPAGALAAVTLTQSQDTNSNESVWNPCTSEPVALTGPIHQIFHVTLNDDGSTHVHIDSNYQGVKGIGQFTGKTYATQDVVMSDVNILGPLPYVQDMHEITHYNFLGNVKFPVPDDFFLHFRFHMTLNATGTPTSTKSTGFEITCK